MWTNIFGEIYLAILKKQFFKIAENLKWPRNVWSTGSQRVLIGIAAEMYYVLGVAESSDYMYENHLCKNKEYLYMYVSVSVNCFKKKGRSYAIYVENTIEQF